MAVNKFLKKVKQIEEQRYRRIEAAPVESGGDESNWLISYADMMTLLCGFFIMLFSMAHLEESKYDSFKEAISKEFGGEYSSPSKDLAKFATQIIQELGVEKEAIVHIDAQGVSIAFESTIFFDSSSADVRTEGATIMNKMIESVSKREKETKKDYRIVVEGHTDSRPIIGGPYPSNWELSGARAARVVRMFLDKGFKPDHLTAIGYADTRPQEPARLPSGEYNDQNLSKNRRVVLRILDPGVSSIPFPTEGLARVPAQEAAGPQPAPSPPPPPAYAFPPGPMPAVTAH